MTLPVRSSHDIGRRAFLDLLDRGEAPARRLHALLLARALHVLPDDLVDDLQGDQGGDVGDGAVNRDVHSRHTVHFQAQLQGDGGGVDHVDLEGQLGHALRRRLGVVVDEQDGVLLDPFRQGQVQQGVAHHHQQVGPVDLAHLIDGLVIEADEGLHRRAAALRPEEGGRLYVPFRLVPGDGQQADEGDRSLPSQSMKPYFDHDRVSAPSRFSSLVPVFYRV